MNELGFVALVFGILGVLFTIKQNVWCWPFAIISVVASIIEFYNERLYGDMALQVFYFFAAIYGWWFWKKESLTEFKVSHIPLKWILILIFASAVQFLIYYFLLKKFKGDKIIFDAILTALSVSATYMMTRKWLENWLTWVIIDLAYVILYIQKDMWLFAVLNVFFTTMAAYGFFEWKKGKV